MNQERAGKILTGAVTERLDQAKMEEAQLTMKQRELVERLKILLEHLENLEVDRASADDSDTPLTKHDEFDVRNEMLKLQRQLAAEYDAKKIPLNQIQEKLATIEKRIESLEALLTGEAVKN